MILVLDNYDSFVHNVARQLREVGAPRVRVVRSDALDVAGIRSLRPSHLVISPGPRAPGDAGVSVRAVRALAGELPILGICLGHQAVAEAFGARIVRARRPLHGAATPVHHDGSGILAGLPRPFLAGRYHSLAVDRTSLPPELVVTARSDDGEVMALRHSELPVWGLQFHPESILTPVGDRIFRGFLALEGMGGTLLATSRAAAGASLLPAAARLGPRP
jgi:para-aminobenzoate synthetase component II